MKQNILKSIFLIVILLTISKNGIAIAQQKAVEQKVEKETTKPLELPAFIIEGVEQHNLKSSIKQMPVRPNALNSKELDSLNTFEKLQPSLLVPEELPTHYVTNIYSKGYVTGSYGLFNTPELAAGYGFYLDRFDIFANAGLSYSGGDAANSENNKLFLNVRSNYIADEKFFIFGGSSTKVGLYLNSQNYNFYGYDKYPANKNYYDRNLMQAKFDVTSDGAFESVLFTVGGSANYITAANNSEASQYVVTKDLNNYYVRGFLTVKNYWKNFLVGGNIYLNIEDVLGSSLNYYQFDASASYFNEKFSALAKAGIQIANNSDNISRGGLLLLGNVEYRMNKLFTIKAEFKSGLEKTNFEDLITINPYISSRLFVDHRYDIACLKGGLWFHPNEKILLNAGVDWRYSDRNLNFIDDTLAEFKLSYINGIIFDIYSEALWTITEKDKLVGKLNVNMNHLSDGKYLTYMPLLKLSATYCRNLIENLDVDATVKIVGDRYFADTKSSKLNSYFNLDIGANYKLKSFNVFLKINNLTNTDYYFWNRYKERGIFASLGLTWQF